MEHKIKPEMTIEQAHEIVNTLFTLNNATEAPAMIIDTPRGLEVSEAFILYCKDNGYF